MGSVPNRASSHREIGAPDQTAQQPMTRRERRELDERSGGAAAPRARRLAAVPEAVLSPAVGVSPVTALSRRPRGDARKALRPNRRTTIAAVSSLASVGVAGAALAVVLVAGTGATQPAATAAGSVAESDQTTVLAADAVAATASGDGEAANQADAKPASERDENFAGGAPNASERSKSEAASRSITRTELPGCDGVRPTGEASNGQLPDEWLCEIGAGGHKLRADAAVAFAKMNSAFKADTGKDLAVTDSYRSLEGQVSVAARKPGFAARPGTSQHGWGIAVDLGAGTSSGTGEQYDWLVANAEEFGWENPDWAQRNSYELWHWEFFPGRD